MFTCTIDSKQFATPQLLRIHIIEEHIEVACALFVERFVKKG